MNIIGHYWSVGCNRDAPALPWKGLAADDRDPLHPEN